MIKSHHYRPDPRSMGCAICFMHKKGYHLQKEHFYGTGIHIEKLKDDPLGYKWSIDEAPIITGEKDDEETLL